MGLLLGRTPLIERRDGRFVVRERDEIERLLKQAYPGEPAVDRLMPGLATVASALNANDQCLARIAAVQSQIAGRVLRLIIPEGSMTPVQREVIKAVTKITRSKGLRLIVTEF